MDDASKLIMAHSVFREEMVQNVMQVLRRAIEKYAFTREPDRSLKPILRRNLFL